MGTLYNNLAEVSLRQNRLEGAVTYYRQAIDVMRKTGNRRVLAALRSGLAEALTSIGDIDGAWREATEAMKQSRTSIHR